MTDAYKNPIQRMLNCCTKEWQSYAYDIDGRGHLHDCPVKDLTYHDGKWVKKSGDGKKLFIGYANNPDDWLQSPVDRSDTDEEKVIHFGGRRNGNADLEKVTKERDHYHGMLKIFEKSNIFKSGHIAELDESQIRYQSMLNQTLQVLYAQNPHATVELDAGELLELMNPTRGKQNEEDDCPF